jgi:hypothetical protein
VEARNVFESSDTERAFIFMTADWPLQNVANLGGVAAEVLSSDVALHHTGGSMGNGVLRRLSAAGERGDRIGV